MKPLPTGARIFGIDVRIRQVSSKRMPEPKGDEGEAFGLCDRYGACGPPATIYIDKSLPLPEQWLTLWHEIYHFVVKDFVGIEIKTSDEVFAETIAGEIMSLCQQWRLL